MILDHRTNIFSQNGEDGVIEYILDKLNITSGTCCEFGAWDGKHLSNTFNLIKNKEWKGLYIESDENKYKDLLETCKEYPNITPVQSFVTGENLDDLILNNDFPEDLDLLSIDVDSIDYEIWKGLKKVRPKLIIIEPCNSTSLWEKDVSYDGHGASPFLIKQLAKEKGYTFLCTTGNLFFVRDDINTLEPNDEIEFPWWLPDDIKRMVGHITNIIPDAHLDDFGKDIIKYARGAKLGYMTNE
jgi:hypothetical protein